MKLKKKVHFLYGYIKVKVTLNNIFIMLCDKHGNILISKQCGMLRSKGTRKKTPYIATLLIRSLVAEMRKKNIFIKLIILQINGFLSNKIVINIVKSLRELKVNNVFYIEYKQSKAHNGLRLKKQRRL